MNKYPLITIGLPVYSAGKFIKQTVNSLLNQSYKNIELIISDDKSDDQSADYCDQLAKKNKRIRFFKQKKRLGFVKNFNFVLNQAKGVYFVWASDDDLWHKDYVSRLFDLHQQYGSISLAVSRFNNIYNNKPYNRIKNQMMKNGKTKLYYLRHYLLTRNLSYFYGMYKTDILLKTGGYHVDARPFFGSSDFLTIFRVLLEGPAAYTDKLLFYKRDTGYYTERFTTFTKLKVPPFKIIFRFSLFPLYHFYDFTYATYFTMLSSLPIRDKIELFFVLSFVLAKYNLIFIGELFGGLFSLVYGVIKHLFK